MNSIKKHRKSLWFALPLYLIALLCMGTYLWFELQPRVMLNPLGRLVLMGAFCLCSYLAGRILCKLPKVKTDRVMKLTFLVYFLCYLCLLLTFTLFDPMFGRNSHAFAFFTDSTIRSNYMEHSFNIVPFRTIAEYVGAVFNGSMNVSIIVTNLLGNLVALMPMALFLPLLFRKCRSFPYFLLATGISVIIIELLQLILASGACDIDDLILNAAGACAAFFLLRIRPFQWLLNKLIPIG